MSRDTTTRYASPEEFQEFMRDRCPALEIVKNSPKVPAFYQPVTVSYHHTAGGKASWKNVLAREYIYKSGERKYEIWHEHPLLL